MNWWQKRQQTDPFVKKRNQQGVLARSYFKIEEIYKKYKIKSKNVLDIGAAPGGWSEYISDKCSNITAIDLLPLKFIKENVKFIQNDIRLVKIEESFDTILSDISPNISGNLLVDNAFMEEMVQVYSSLLQNNLQTGGYLIFKSFQWECNKLALQILTPHFESIKIFKPQSSRRSSPELYVICQNKLSLLF